MKKENVKCSFAPINPVYDKIHIFYLPKKTLKEEKQERKPDQA
jgi:hypothetical protein